MVKKIDALLYSYQKKSEIENLAICLSNIPQDTGCKPIKQNDGLYLDYRWSFFIETIDEMITDAEYTTVINNLTRAQKFEQWISNTLQTTMELFKECIPLIISCQSNIVSQEEINNVDIELNKLINQTTNLLGLTWGQDSWPITHSIYVATTPYTGLTESPQGGGGGGGGGKKGGGGKEAPQPPSVILPLFTGYDPKNTLDQIIVLSVNMMA